MAAIAHPNYAEWERLARFHKSDCDEHWASMVLWWAEASGYKYVNSQHRLIQTTHGDVVIPYGRLSDGASGPAPDFEPDSWWAHDELYLHPIAYDGPSLVRLTRRQSDEVYRNKTSRRWLGLYAPLAYRVLRLTGWRAWRYYRRFEQRHGALRLLQSHTLPHPELWHLPSDRLADAVLR